MNKFINFIQRHRYDIFFSIILVLLFVFVFTISPQEETKNIITLMENKTFDIRQNVIAKNKHVNKDIIIITVDDPSYEYLIETYGDWPIPRSVYADILDYVHAQNPKFVAFDLLFIKSLNRIPGSDKKLVDRFKKYQNTYTAINFDNFSYDLRKPPLLDKKLNSKITIESDKIDIYKFTNCRMIHDEIIAATDKIGHINTPKADDGFIRKIPLVIKYPRINNKLEEIQDDYYLYMTVKLAADYLNKYENENITDIKIDKNNNLILGSRKIPLTENGEAILNWYGDTGLTDKRTFKYVSFWEVLKSKAAKEAGEKEILPPDIFKVKFVYIGTNIFSLSDIKTVPTSKYLPGVEIHTTLLNNILDDNIIHKASLPYNILIASILAIAAAYTVFKLRSVYVSITSFSVLICGFLYFSTYVMEKYHVWTWMAIPLILALFIFVCSFIVKYLLKSRDFEYTYKLATTDGLTELYNHRFFQEQMKKKIEIAEKNNGKLSLILLDIDFFKKFNDKYGHQAGDAVLKHVAKTLKNCVRNSDYVCRYGGEEMAIILDNTTRETAVNIAQKICETIASKNYNLTPDLSVNITVSLGVATYSENGNSVTELIEYSDKCLYKAKENGRNQVGFIE